MTKGIKKNELKAVLDAERTSSLSSMRGAGKLTEQRTRAMDYYMGEMANDMPAPEGQSSAISTDVSDTIDSLLPDMMDIFCGGDEVVRLEPTGPDDVEAAEQESDYLNFVFMRQNPGYRNLYSYCKDALLQKTGIVKISWESKEEETEHSYYDLDDDAFDLLVSEEGVEVLEHTEKPQPGDGPSETPASDSAYN